MRIILILTVFFCTQAGFSASQSGTSDKNSTPPEISRRHFPMVQSLGSTELYLNGLFPRLKDYAFVAYKKGDRTAVPIKGEIVRVTQDPEKRLHEKILRVKFSGLEAATVYDLEILEVSRFGQQVVNVRDMETSIAEDGKPRPVRFTVVSCMCDEPTYEDARQAVVRKELSLNPEVVFVIGDLTYVDSFDAVERGKATDYDVYARTTKSFSENPLTRSKKITRVSGTWDDHDTGIDNGNKDTPTIVEARKAFLALYGFEAVPGVIDAAPDRIYHHVRLGGQNFILLDNRSFRTHHSDDSRYGHLGQEQEEWLLKVMKNSKGPFHLLMGDMWGSAVITALQGGGKIKRLTESFYGDHPTQYKALMAQINALNVPYVLYSGDIHFSQVIEHGPSHAGTPREAPFFTAEITSSPAHSILFKAKPGESEFWTDPQRILGVPKSYNFAYVESLVGPSETLEIDTKFYSFDETPASRKGPAEIKELPVIQWGTTIDPLGIYRSKRQQILNPNYRVSSDKKVKVLFLDADDTLRIAPSKSVSANSPTDVALLPGVADTLAEYAERGFLIAIVSNQGGVTYKFVTMETATGAIEYLIQLIEAANPKAKVHYYDIAPQGSGDFYTKPNIGMGAHLERILAAQGVSIDWGRSLMVGDSQYKKGQVSPRGVVGNDYSDSDRLFAQNLGIRSLHPREFFKWTPEEEKAIRARDVPGFQRKAAEPVCKMLFQ